MHLQRARAAPEIPFLDRALLDLSTPDQIPTGMQSVVDGLTALSDSLGPTDWQACAAWIRRNHPIMGVLNQCPATSRALCRPRGYPGDAVLLDLLYSAHEAHHLKAASSVQGQAICRWLAERAAPSLNWRLSTIAGVMDQVASAKQGARVLSVACGHLREGGRSQALAQRAFGEFVALDQDRQSLRVVEEQYAHLGVRALHGSIGHLMRRELSFEGPFDLIYAAGLYDYLDAATARALNASLFALLAPGGRLHIANFQPGGAEFAYMECCMAWPLVFRTRSELMATCVDLPEHTRAWASDPWGYVGYVDVRNAG